MLVIGCACNLEFYGILQACICQFSSLKICYAGSEAWVDKIGPYFTEDCDLDDSILEEYTNILF